MVLISAVRFFKKEIAFVIISKVNGTFQWIVGNIKIRIGTLPALFFESDIGPAIRRRHSKLEIPISQGDTHLIIDFDWLKVIRESVCARLSVCVPFHVYPVAS